MGFTANEDRLRQEIAANPWFGSWDEWAAAHFNHLPVFTRAALGHMYGRHDVVSSWASIKERSG